MTNVRSQEFVFQNKDGSFHEEEGVSCWKTTQVESNAAKQVGQVFGGGCFTWEVSRGRWVIDIEWEGFGKCRYLGGGRSSGASAFHEKCDYKSTTKRRRGAHRNISLDIVGTSRVFISWMREKMADLASAELEAGLAGVQLHTSARVSRLCLSPVCSRPRLDLCFGLAAAHRLSSPSLSLCHSLYYNSPSTRSPRLYR